MRGQGGQQRGRAGVGAPWGPPGLVEWGHRGLSPDRHPTLETGYVSLSQCLEPRGEILAGN